MSKAQTTATKSILLNIPKAHRTELLKGFDNIVKNFREERWEPSALNGGKFCEVVYSILEGHTTGKFPPRPRKPENMADACRRLEQADKNKFCRSVRIQIPRMLVPLYEIRNNRGVGHVGGDVDPNHMDALAVLNMSKWILAELIRVFHKTDTSTATHLVEKLVERTVATVWRVNGKRRVLNPKLKYQDQMLLILYDSPGRVKEGNLIDWLEHSNPSIFRRDVIRKAHRARLIDYDENTKQVQISPTGIRHVEDNLPLEI